MPIFSYDVFTPPTAQHALLEDLQPFGPHGPPPRSRPRVLVAQHRRPPHTLLHHGTLQPFTFALQLHPTLAAVPAARGKKGKENGEGEKNKAECTVNVLTRMSHFVLMLNFLFFSLEAKERGEFMALQLIALVTVNRPLSEAVRVFYGRLFALGLCRGSHL